ncbi:hypothetical protein EKH55_4612 [Sinorhizobium alkalisoli]|nr:hypothetical protein EKH55_4612 [Sinorhizobium alkalisoli]
MAIDQVASEHAGQDDDGTMRPMSSGSVAKQKPTDIIG